MLDKQKIISAKESLPGRSEAMRVNDTHFVNGSNLKMSSSDTQQEVVLGMGCFWGAERLFWQVEGVISTSVGYAGGYTPNPTYDEVCSGKTGHTEVVRVVFDPQIVPLTTLLKQFWENHDPTQGMRQGNDIGTQYRSVIYTRNEQQLAVAKTSMAEYQSLLNNQLAITTEVALLTEYYFAEDYHQQYLAKNPEGYCGLGGTGVCFPPER
ncbi:peptide-methionine (S)-S-oxide reductase MsrA [Vibrio marisflavi]|uniref:Peptide methionine sulfoxide reductase MsrA n=1 Tax=Vibrio marisflavi CECT 7928 TaxID=634439 RepID=A0ABN8E9L0_9VIBR|nr:peptide-methionine (S)-S-oxide reductase MsrA [Vibrio marisflavi]CAH0541611.1 Peptide methionine sulfoxide reductase MsrA [Vibrio marisflavi CECT 7928]